ncbi:HTH-type transcriptional regulator EthR [Planctomycetes bacterium CA13]|uniref:HTH-type transcriptional regulator EthR n=1 Tax=Novipirellula herctigrandis TaxID=2527986 RepID=A0A5C5Z0V2_9BACT|nr:HTH-type transcriptional regulator EthR [Planctomycetes bacterium CA13]
MSHCKLNSSILESVPSPAVKPRKSEQTRTEILEAALDFLWTQPFRDLTVNELMSKTSAGRSAFYQYFGDLYELIEALLCGLEASILDVATPWLQGEGDALALLKKSLTGLVQVCYDGGPILRAVSDAAVSDERLEKEWNRFLGQFDDAVAARIEQHQGQGLIASFEARPVAMALNRMDASLLIQAFGSRPRSQPEPIREAIIRVWTSTLYPQIVCSP